MVFSAVSYRMLPHDADNLSILMGMFTGLGGFFVVFGIARLVRSKTASPEKLKQQEIERTDERNIQITKAAYTIACATATVLFIVMAFVFVFLDYRTPAFISIGAMYVQLIAFYLAYRYHSKRM